MPNRRYPNRVRALSHVLRQRRDSMNDHLHRLEKLSPDTDATITIQSAIDKQGYVMFPRRTFNVSLRS